MNIRLTLIALAGLVCMGAASAGTITVVPVESASPVATRVAPTVEDGKITNTPKASQALVSDAQPSLIADGKMRASLGLGASAASGNTRASNLALTASAVQATEKDKVSLYGLALQARADGKTSGEQIRAGGRYDYNLTQTTFGFGGLDLERNRFSNLKVRGQLSGGLGYHYLATKADTWDLYGGLAYTADKYIEPTTINGAVRNTYVSPALMLGEESNHVLSNTTSVRQRVVVYPNLRDRGEYRATVDTGLSVAMTRSLSLNVGLGASYNSQPGDGRKKLDTLATTGVSVKFD